MRLPELRMLLQDCSVIVRMRETHATCTLLAASTQLPPCTPKPACTRFARTAHDCVHAHDQLTHTLLPACAQLPACTRLSTVNAVQGQTIVRTFCNAHETTRTLPQFGRTDVVLHLPVQKAWNANDKERAALSVSERKAASETAC